MVLARPLDMRMLCIVEVVDIVFLQVVIGDDTFSLFFVKQLPESINVYGLAGERFDSFVCSTFGRTNAHRAAFKWHVNNEQTQVSSQLPPSQTQT